MTSHDVVNEIMGRQKPLTIDDGFGLIFAALMASPERNVDLCSELNYVQKRITQRLVDIQTDRRTELEQKREELWARGRKLEERVHDLQSQAGRLATECNTLSQHQSTLISVLRAAEMPLATRFPTPSEAMDRQRRIDAAQHAVDAGRDELRKREDELSLVRSTLNMAVRELSGIIAGIGGLDAELEGRPPLPVLGLQAAR